jgi:hypothetical protein
MMTGGMVMRDAPRHFVRLISPRVFNEASVVGIIAIPLGRCGQTFNTSSRIDEPPTSYLSDAHDSQ